MSRVGVAFIEAVRPERETLLRALDAWAAKAGRMPDLLPVWSRRSGSPDGQRWHLDPTLLAAISERGVEPVIYLESTGARYEDILRGLHDDELRLLACKADGHVVRWDQEPDGDFGQDWSRHELYADVFRHVSHVLRSEADIRMWWCPVVPKRAIAYYPGSEAVDIVGFDRYSWTEGSSFPLVQWATPVKQLDLIAPGKIRWVGECGRKAGLTRRAAWLREAASGLVEAAVVMDMLVPGHDHDWRWVPSMYAAFPGIGGAA